MPSLEVGQVTAALRHILQAVRDAAVASSATLPERQYVTTGGAVFDCAQVTVSGNAGAIGLAGDLSDVGGLTQLGNCDTGWNMVVEVAIVRDASEMMAGTRGELAPPVDCIESDTEQADKDGSILVSALESIAGGAPGQIGNIPMSLQFGEVAGGLTAVLATATVNLWDMPPPPPPEP